MASWMGHVQCSAVLGAAYGFAASYALGFEWPIAAMAGLLCGIGGLLPDLDGGSDVLVRELFGLLGFAVPILLLRRIVLEDITPEQVLLVCGGIYLAIRYGLYWLFSRFAVHRGMFHSIPAMLIVGLVVYIGYKHPSEEVRFVLAAGVMLGFLSHLILDELYEARLSSLAPKLNKFAGSAIKLKSKSIFSNVTCYSLLSALSGTAVTQHADATGPLANGQNPPAIVSPAGPTHPPTAPGTQQQTTNASKPTFGSRWKFGPRSAPPISVPNNRTNAPGS